MSRHRKPCKCKDTPVLVVGKGPEDVLGLVFERAGRGAGEGTVGGIGDQKQRYLI